MTTGMGTAVLERHTQVTGQVMAVSGSLVEVCLLGSRCSKALSSRTPRTLSWRARITAVCFCLLFFFFLLFNVHECLQMVHRLFFSPESVPGWRFVFGFMWRSQEQGK